ncbi:hypothetical protein CC86DRAFT_406890 [Ophiobolus disseminans]|uniref:F-box domain-containing protein n=1 Tax=Ophiobolus disseminans TaxID=1469910 RepID=A0A6A6ZYW3_9PLEO|nr:hypothetical protein CC86DRAFT_406890 [Ophiobolus disseminans]
MSLFGHAQWPSPPQENQPSFPQIFHLPVEIRCLIWIKVLHTTSGTNLLLASKEIYEDAAPVFYQTKTFRLTSPKDLRTFAASSGLTPCRSKLIRNLELVIDCLYLTDHFMPGTTWHGNAF